MDTRSPGQLTKTVLAGITIPEVTRVRLYVKSLLHNHPKHKQCSNHDAARPDKTLCQGQRPTVRTPERQGFACIHTTRAPSMLTIKHERGTSRRSKVRNFQGTPAPSFAIFVFTHLYPGYNFLVVLSHLFIKIWIAALWMGINWCA